MIEGGWQFVVASYALTVASLGGLALVVVLRLRTWAKRAAALENTKP
ncbi:MAG: heme exporter protein CcmD [Hyphomonadaceae bacterium]